MKTGLFLNFSQRREKTARKERKIQKVYYLMMAKEDGTCCNVYYSVKPMRLRDLFAIRKVDVKNANKLLDRSL
jgi:hypothetical protein